MHNRSVLIKDLGFWIQIQNFDPKKRPNDSNGRMVKCPGYWIQIESGTFRGVTRTRKQTERNCVATLARWNNFFERLMINMYFL
jgi:hypothetical protein